MMIIRQLGLQPYHIIWERMKAFTIARQPDATDECWLLEHPPVYTQGQAGKPEHIVNPGNIAIVQTDRGGQVTYHGPGQLVAYVLMDLRRKKIGIRTLVTSLENNLITLLANHDILANSRCEAPGVYVNDKKIASIGLRVKNGCTYHGIALNVSMDLTPFSGINPCGYERLQMTQISDFIPTITISQIADQFQEIISQSFEH